MKKYITIEQKKNCCGCGGCANICPKNAITMKEDNAGYIFPCVDENLCVECGRCIDVCVFTEKGVGANENAKVYAAVYKEREVLLQSSSGGIFTPLATAVLNKGGAVFGAAWSEDFTLKHIPAENEEELNKLRGSKYVQSSTGGTFRQVKKMLAEGRYVCYSGTPCQIAGLKAFLGKEYENLLTVDLVCHGVPSMKMLSDDIEYVSGKKISDIKDIKFRDKNYGWGVKGSLKTADSTIKYNAGTSPYYFYFLKGEVYRESCYNCRFPAENRQGDITLGDYWGIRQELIAKLGNINADEGISCVLVNSEKGQKWLEEIKGKISFVPTERASVEKRNAQLTKPSTPLPEHETLLNEYIDTGYSAFKNAYKKRTKDHIVRAVKNIIPTKIKRKLNDLR